ncbi:hypothetical protein GMOD_00001815 [Pyrenophora seminiperda CCB06]|uniref:Uncharacterized protein n=1 Tax=Pyrenophora seminiperda CCB06 TaxID=1302712 RepID=A0A3M7LW95_9PLEO|nr:hypothetical protein GMOD_00001815 [Pyrenophora seminiperda CCB06]
MNQSAPGQGTSKSARQRRRYAAKKAALLSKDDSPTVSKKLGSAPSMSTFKVITITNADLAKSPPTSRKSQLVKTVIPDGFAYKPKTVPVNTATKDTGVNKEPISSTGLEQEMSQVLPKTDTMVLKETQHIEDETKTQVKTAMLETSTAVPPFEKSTNASTTSSSTHEEHGYESLLVMIRPKREGLLWGPRITVYIGDAYIADIAKQFAMAASPLLYKHFIKNPQSAEYHFSHGQVHPGAIRLLLIGWIEGMCHKFSAHAVPFQKTFAENIAVLRAAHFLGMQKYCSHIMQHYINYLKFELPSYAEIVIVEKNATSDTNPLWTAMINNLCHIRHKGQIPDPKEFQDFLGNHPRLKKSIESADAFFATYAKQRAEVREAECRQAREKKKAERQQALEKEQAERRQQDLLEQRTIASIRQKMDNRTSGLLTVTVGEAELLRRRMSTR